MNSLSTYIIEKLKINKDIKIYNYHPKDKKELRSLIKELLKERGKDANLNDIDVSDITDMSELFTDLDPYNINISEWDVSNVKNMGSMFYGCKNFNSDISRWNVSNVEDMSYMFDNCKKFNSDLSNWDVSNVKDMRRIFNGCKSLKNKPSWYNEQFKYIYNRET